MRKPGVAVFWLHASPQVLASRFDSDDEHRPAYGPDPAAFLAAQAAHREPLIASIGAYRIDVDGLTPDEVVARVADVLGSIEA